MPAMSKSTAEKRKAKYKRYNANIPLELYNYLEWITLKDSTPGHMMTVQSTINRIIQEDMERRTDYKPGKKKKKNGKEEK